MYIENIYHPSSLMTFSLYRPPVTSERYPDTQQSALSKQCYVLGMHFHSTAARLQLTLTPKPEHHLIYLHHLSFHQHRCASDDPRHMPTRVLSDTQQNKTHTAVYQANPPRPRRFVYTHWVRIGTSYGLGFNTGLQGLKAGSLYLHPLPIPYHLQHAKKPFV